MRRFSQRSARVAHSAPPILLCALAAHAAAYRSLRPQDGLHGYFGWYEPAVGVLTLVAVLVLGGVLLCLAGGIELPAAMRSSLGLDRPVPVTQRALALGAAAAALLGLQEAGEHLVAEGELSVEGLSAGRIAALVGALIASAVLLALAGRSFQSLGRRLLAAQEKPSRRPPLRVWIPPASDVWIRCKPLPFGPALRAPPPA
jgi:hypothetical protein